MNHETYMRRALVEAQTAYEEGEIPVGALVVWKDKIIARGRNMTEKLSDPTAHAEMIALTSAFNTLGGKYLGEATLYVTLEPCLMCCGALYWSKIGSIVYGAEDQKNGFRRIVQDRWPFHPKTSLESGVLAEEAAALMKSFFKARR